MSPWAFLVVLIIDVAGEEGKPVFSPTVRKHLDDHCFKLHQSVEAKWIPGMGRSFVASSDIPQGTVLLEACMIYDIHEVADAIKLHPSVAKAAIPKDCDQLCRRRALLSMGLEYESRKEKKTPGSSVWGAYVNELYPKTLNDIGNIAAFEMDEIEAFRDTSVHNRIKNYVTVMQYDRELIKGLKDVFTSEFGGNPPGEYEFRYWYGVVQSRSFYLSKYPPLLIGGFDCCINHHVDDSACADFELPKKDDEETPSDGDEGPDLPDVPPATEKVAKEQRIYKMTAHKDFNKGEQVYHFYDQLGSLDLLTDYGFIRPEDKPIEGILGTETISYPSWAEEFPDEWEAVCNAQDDDAYSDIHFSAWPEGNLVCLRASAYESHVEALEAKKADWLVPYDDQKNEWNVERKIPASWLRADQEAYKLGRDWCSEVKARTSEKIANWSFKLSEVKTEGKDEDRIARLEKLVKALAHEAKLATQCSDGMAKRLGDVDKLMECCASGDVEEL